MKLSERLEVFVKGQCTDAELRAALRDALTLAKRYEDAPVGHYDTYHVYSPAYPNKMPDGEFVAWMVSMKTLNGQRVRIVLDKEG